MTKRDPGGFGAALKGFHGGADMAATVEKLMRTDSGTSALFGRQEADRLTDNDPMSPVDEGQKSGQK